MSKALKSSPVPEAGITAVMSKALESSPVPEAGITAVMASFAGPDGVCA
jgi:hypothetical protein